MAKQKVRTVERSARTGEFVKSGTEKRRPATTVVEKIKVRPQRSGKKR
jgi:hypothetical protein